MNAGRQKIRNASEWTRGDMLNSPSWAMQRRISAQVHLQKILYRNKTSAPYLSGDAFASLCDYKFHQNTANNTIGLANATSIFCQSDKVEELLNQHGDQISAVTLVLGNSDRDFYNFEISLPLSIKKVFLQNSHLPGSIFYNLPIGLENLRYGRNGLPRYFTDKFHGRLKKNRILVGPFSPTHPERSELIGWGAIKDKRISYLNNYLTPGSLAAYSAQYKFIACPRGNGTDTHRFWETLYRGSIPVVKRSKWSESMESLGLPLIQLTVWSFEEFLNLSINYEEFEVVPNDIPSLWIEYWEKEIQLGPNQFLN